MWTTEEEGSELVGRKGTKEHATLPTFLATLPTFSERPMRPGFRCFVTASRPERDPFQLRRSRRRTCSFMQEDRYSRLVRGGFRSQARGPCWSAIESGLRFAGGGDQSYWVPTGEHPGRLQTAGPARGGAGS